MCGVMSPVPPILGVMSATEKPSRISRWTHSCSARTIWATALEPTTNQKKRDDGNDDE